MKRSSVLKLRQPEWVKVSDLDNLEVQVVAEPGGDLGSEMFEAQKDPSAMRRLVTNAITGFRGYTDDDGNELPNERKYREELAAVAAVQVAVRSYLMRKQAELYQGEGNAASDSLSTESRS